MLLINTVLSIYSIFSYPESSIKGIIKNPDFFKLYLIILLNTDTGTILAYATGQNSLIITSYLSSIGIFSTSEPNS
jgi:hypothetical protein